MGGTLHRAGCSRPVQPGLGAGCHPLHSLFFPSKKKAISLIPLLDPVYMRRVWGWQLSSSTGTSCQQLHMGNATPSTSPCPALHWLTASETNPFSDKIRLQFHFYLLKILLTKTRVILGGRAAVWSWHRLHPLQVSQTLRPPSLPRAHPWAAAGAAQPSPHSQ